MNIGNFIPLRVLQSGWSVIIPVSAIKEFEATVYSQSHEETTSCLPIYRFFAFWVTRDVEVLSVITKNNGSDQQQ